MAAWPRYSAHICDCRDTRLGIDAHSYFSPTRHHELGRRIMTTFRAAQVTSPGAGLTLIDRTLADPGPGTVRVVVEACGICHSRE